MSTALDVAARLFRLVPKNLVSWATGSLVRLRLPPPLRGVLCRGFAGAFKLNMAEAALPLSAYRTIEEVFTRPLKPGLRPLCGVVASPADGYLARSAPAEAGKAVQAKGLDYDLGELVTGSADAGRALDLAWYQTIYLAPHNYHRVHAPFTGTVTAIRHLPGELWPVNVPFVSRIPRLFARNERLVFDFTLAAGGRAYVVMVGAFNVGRMVTPLAPGLVTNRLRRQVACAPREATLAPPRPVAQGEEIGTFMLGSTVVIAYDRQALAAIRLVQAGDTRPILMGQSLCEA